jgi:hypothetical protein
MRVIALTDLEKRIDRRKAELGITGDDFVPHNNGKHRSPGKRALLQRLREIAAEKGTPPKFGANF